MKPIFIVRMPYGMPVESIQKATNELESQLKEDYHVLVVEHNGFDFEFEAFYPKEIEEKHVETVLEHMKERYESELQAWRASQAI
jgi:hypothetical protein